MRRGLQLQSESDYLAALALVPELADRKQGLIKTLRALAEFYAAHGRLEDAVLLFERVALEAAQPTKIFWCDYARLVFRLAEKQLRENHVAQANLSLEKIRELASKAPGHAEMEALCREAYLQVGAIFEQASSFVAAELYLQRALAIPPGPAAQDGLKVLSELTWRAYDRRDFKRVDHWVEWALKLDTSALNPKLGHPVARVAFLLGALGSSAAQNHLPELCDHYFSWGERILRQAGGPQGSVELADLLVSWGSCASSKIVTELRFQEALDLREALLGDKHPKTLELRAALGLYGESGFKQGFEHDPEPKKPEIRPFSTARAATKAEIKILHRRLVKLVHPDQAHSDEEFELRNTLMGQINEAAKAGDGAGLAKLGAKARLELKQSGWLRAQA
jgi:tetratricopeptide (TPR) repeat protein